MAPEPMTICQVLDDAHPEKSGCQSRKVRSLHGRGAMSKGCAAGYTEAFGERLSLAIERAGGVLAVARALEVSKDTPGRWRDGASKISLHDVERLAEISELDPSWLAFGVDDLDRRIDYGVVQEAAETVIEIAIGLGQSIDPSALARTIRERSERLARERPAIDATLLTSKQTGGR